MNPPHGMDFRLYLDNAATTPLLPEVLAESRRWLETDGGNPSSLHAYGAPPREALGEARREIARLAGAPPQGVVFTSGGTESVNLALRGVFALPRPKANRLLISALEHPAVAQTAAALARQGVQVETLPATPEGVVDLEALAPRLGPDLRMVSVMAVNNELGTRQPLEAIGRMLRNAAPKAVFHVDAVQAFAKVDIPWREAGVGLLSVSAHKVHGAKGAGALIRFQPIELEPQLTGGGQEGGLRSGTENPFAIAAFAAAARRTQAVLAAQADERAQYHQRWLDFLEGFPRLQVFRSGAALPYIVSVSLPGVPAEVILHHLEQQGLIVSTGSACSSAKPQPSPALLAAGFTPQRALSTVRLSFSLHNRLADLDDCFQRWKLAMEKLVKL